MSCLTAYRSSDPRPEKAMNQRTVRPSRRGPISAKNQTKNPSLMVREEKMKWHVTILKILAFLLGSPLYLQQPADPLPNPQALRPQTKR
jgi:hypothetical protein